MTVESYAQPLAIPRLRTRRLLLREYLADDLEPFAAMHADLEVMRHIGEGVVLDRTGTWRSLAVGIGHWQLRGYGMWVVCDQGTGEVLGRCGLVNPFGWPGLEVGWMLGRSHWGQGYATEAARAALEYGWTVLAARRLISLIRPANLRSAALATRLGATRESVTEVAGAPADVWLHAAPSLTA
ncbi:MAG: GNAT family N-acetyltransferase [Candidatus Dormibacteria bacterium]